MFARTRAMLAEALEQRACPAIVCEVGRASGPVWRDALGRLAYSPDARPCVESTPFDLASLTKVIATTSLVLRQVRAGTLTIETPVQTLLPAWQGAHREAVTIGHLLDHSSGLPAHRRLWEQVDTAAELRRAVMGVTFERLPGTASVYSDIGFMLLGFALERAGDAPLDSQWTALWPAGYPALAFNPPRAQWDAIAPTEIDPWRGRLLQGEVHDEHAALLGGVAAHAGLFGTAAAVGAFAATVLQSFETDTWLATPGLIRQFAARRPVPDSSRALGWDTMRPTSSCGTRLSAASIGHTGFTGTSLWIDPMSNLYVVVLSNRVHPTRSNERYLPLRARIHDAVMADLDD